MTPLRERFRAWLAHRRAQRITFTSALERAGRGARYLDEVDPGWYERVDVQAMELAHASCCVLGQLHGDFRRGLSRAHLLSMGSAPRASLSPVDMGFLCVQHVSPALQEEDYRHLDRAWQQEVQCRQREVQEVGGLLWEERLLALKQEEPSAALVG